MNFKNYRNCQGFDQHLSLVCVALIAVLMSMGCSCNTQHKSDRKTIITAKRKLNTQTEKQSSVDYNMVFDNAIVDGTKIELLEMGKLSIPTGKVVACDPLTTPNPKPFTKTITPGQYPVKIYIAKTEKSGDRYAIAKLEFSSEKADRWILATQDGDDISKLTDKDDFLGFPVDAGLACFFDDKVGREYRKFENDLMTKHPGGNIYDDFLAAEFKKNAKEPNNPNDAGDWVNLKIPNTNDNIVMFQSGYGDGTYPSYWGVTKNNKIVSLIIDFLVLPLKSEKK
ncbi:DUF4241 domain-containing protein [Mucilaginibacter rubeus]|uniref:DUF4241 domain-containing protein n=1 Tax=Mucilaginibacter rubeus TaxID=2027860 RepID=UPI00166E8CB0|nr:DUF4241 domain-containing protein [Mucilaginibacter rubeus]